MTTAPPRPIDPRLELVATIVLALATVATAWAGFQSAKWGGVEADLYARAGAARSDAVRVADEASTDRTLDVVAFTTWLTALDAEIRDDPGVRPDGEYVPRPGAASTFALERFRPELRTAFDAWVTTRPLTDPEAPSTPFEMPTYVLAAQLEADDLLDIAETRAVQARDANLRGDSYVLLGVLLAMVLFFGALGAKARTAVTAKRFVVLSTVTLVATLVVLATFPVHL